MIADFVNDPVGVYALTFLVGIGVGLIATDRSFRAWASAGLISIVFVLLASTRTADALFAAPVYVLTVCAAGTVVDVRRFSHTPLLVDEPLWRKVLLVFAHPGAIRAAERVDDAPAAGDSRRAPGA